MRPFPSAQGVECGTWGQADPLPFPTQVSPPLPSPMSGPGSGQAGFSSSGDWIRNSRGHPDPPCFPTFPGFSLVGGDRNELPQRRPDLGCWLWVPTIPATQSEQGLELPTAWPASLVSVLCSPSAHLEVQVRCLPKPVSLPLPMTASLVLLIRTPQGTTVVSKAYR